MDQKGFTFCCFQGCFGAIYHDILNVFTVV
jgi:hypothetical protein